MPERARVRIADSIRSEVFARAGGLCEYCRADMDYSTDLFCVDHVKPTSRGGTTEVANLAMSCQGCNCYKHAREVSIDPVTDETVPLFNPRTQSWNDHFCWSADSSRVVGLTPIGRATIETLRMNRSGVVRCRKALAAYHCSRSNTDD